MMTRVIGHKGNPIFIEETAEDVVKGEVPELAVTRGLEHLGFPIVHDDLFEPARECGIFFSSQDAVYAKDTVLHVLVCCLLCQHMPCHVIEVEFIGLGSTSCLDSSVPYNRLLSNFLTPWLLI